MANPRNPRGMSPLEFRLLAALLYRHGRSGWLEGLPYSQLSEITGIDRHNLNKPLGRLRAKGVVETIESGWRIPEARYSQVVQKLSATDEGRSVWVASELNEHLLRNRGQDGFLLARLVARILCGLPWDGDLQDRWDTLRSLVPNTMHDDPRLSELCKRGDVDGLADLLCQSPSLRILEFIPRQRGHIAGNALGTSPTFYYECLKRKSFKAEFEEAGRVRVHLFTEASAHGIGDRSVAGELWLVVERLALACLERDRALGLVNDTRVRYFEGLEATPESLSEAQSNIRSVMEEGLHLEEGARLSVSVCEDHLDVARKLVRGLRHRAVSYDQGLCAFSATFSDSKKACERQAAWKVVVSAGAFSDSDSDSD